LKAIPQATVRRIYRERYWLPASCPALPPPLALFHFDAAVNQGVAAAARLLQEAVGAAVDGEIGPETLADAVARPVPQSLPPRAPAPPEYSRPRPPSPGSGRAGPARVDAPLAAASARATLPPPLPAPQQQEKRPMAERPRGEATDPPAEAPAPATKWWGHSM